MRKINRDSIEFKNFKNAVERNKLKSNSVNIDLMILTIKENNIKLSKKEN